MSASGLSERAGFEPPYRLERGCDSLGHQLAGEGLPGHLERAPRLRGKLLADHGAAHADRFPTVMTPRLMKGQIQSKAA